MILKQYYLGCLAHASYLLGDQESQTAVIVDPQRDIDHYLEDAQQHNLQIRHVFLTHFHADFVAGHLELRDRTGAQIHMSVHAQTEYQRTPMKDGDLLEFGQVRLQTLETPGHTPESLSILVYDLEQNSDAPHAVLTGDTLFIGDVGRPDLGASIGWKAEDLAAMLYDSLHQKLLPLPDATLVYPAHGAGSLCGKNLSEETYSTMGVQRQYNYALQPMEQEKFIELVTADQHDAPEYFAYDAELNAKEHATLDENLATALNPLELEEVLSLQQEGAQLLDVREETDFEGAHLEGCTNIPLDGKYATWVGTLLRADIPIVLIAAPGAEEEAAMRLGRIGFDKVAGYLKGGMQALAPRPDLVRRTQRITAATLGEHLAAPEPPLVLDVRMPGEWQEKHIEGSRNIPLNHIEKHIDEIPRDRHIVVHCAGGYRSAIAASILERCGLENVADLVGGIAAWEAAQLQTVA